MKDALLRLAAHWSWASEKVPGELSDVEDEPLSVLGHIVAAEIVWLDRLEGLAHSTPVWPDWSLDECKEQSAAVRQRLARYLEATDEALLSGEVSYVNSAGQSFSSTRADVLLHLFLHGTYHRGELSGALRAAGTKIPPTDLIAFTRGAPAATRQ